MTGWVMLAGYLIGTVAEVVVLGPSVLAVAGVRPAGPWPLIGIDTAVCLVMGVIAIVGIRMTARIQILMAVIEYAILAGISVAGLIAVLARHPGTFRVSSGWWHLAGIGGRGSLAASLLIAVYSYSLWDGTIYVNEEVRHRRVNPGRAAMWAVALLAVLYTLAQAGLQGIVSPARLQAHSATALVYVAQALGGGTAAKMMAAAIALSVTATTGTGIVLTSRIAYGMASHRTLPEFLSKVSVRFRTPARASLTVLTAIIALTATYMLTASLTTVFASVVAVAGLLAAMFYIMTGLAMIAYYRRKITASPADAVTVGVLPLAAAGFLAWVLTEPVRAAPVAEAWSLAGILAAGLVLMLAARYGLQSRFFRIPRESWTPPEPP
jgi:amino acid transporter